MRFGMPAPRWRLRGLEGGVRVARPERLAGIEVPLTDAQAAAIEAIHIRIYTPEPRGVTLKVNGRKAGQQASAKLEAGWQTATIPVEAGRFTEGENFIAFELGRGKDAAVAWIQLGGEPSAARIASPVRYEAGAPSSDDSDDSGDSGESKAAPGGDDGDGDDDDSGAEAAGSAASGEDTDSASGEDDDGPGRA
jgi:hypothetical protein